jgi:hypothetical protein
MAYAAATMSLLQRNAILLMRFSGVKFDGAPGLCGEPLGDGMKDGT